MVTTPTKLSHPLIRHKMDERLESYAWITRKMILKTSRKTFQKRWVETYLVGLLLWSQDSGFWTTTVTTIDTNSSNQSQISILLCIQSCVKESKLFGGCVAQLHKYTACVPRGLRLFACLLPFFMPHQDLSTCIFISHKHVNTWYIVSTGHLHGSNLCWSI
jgi:hypothetical protein